MPQNIQTNNPTNRSQKLPWSYGFAAFERERVAKTRNGNICRILSKRKVISDQKW